MRYQMIILFILLITTIKMRNFLDDKSIFDVIRSRDSDDTNREKIEKELDNKAYNTFNMDRDEAWVYVWIAIYWEASFCWWKWWKLDWTIYEKDDHYLCQSYWISFESYRSLKTTLKFLDWLSELLFKYENIKWKDTQTKQH